MAVAYVDWVWVTRDLKSAVLYAASEMVANVAAVTALWLLAERFDGIGPWSKPQFLFMLGYATLVRGLMDTLFSYNVLFISRRIGPRAARPPAGPAAAALDERC